MPTLTAHRFTLQPYAGPKSRATCPACGKPRCFTRYLDTDTGELLPDEFGRCDHEVSCGYARNPYQRDAGGLSYATATERGEARPAGPAPARRAPPPAPAPAAVVSIPADVFTASLAHYERNNLAHLLRAHFGVGVADEPLSRYQVGTSAHWPGACVFWLTDERGRVRGGQVVLYDDTGHTGSSRAAVPPGRIRPWPTPASAGASPLPPGWPTTRPTARKAPVCLGCQLATALAGQPVALVESAKTAMLAAPYFPRYCWLATMGLSYLTAEPGPCGPPPGTASTRARAGCLASQSRRAARPGLRRYRVGRVGKLATADERAAGLDLADVLLREWPATCPVGTNPASSAPAPG
ncbi:MAG: DUF6371 domain-containing protein [Hymenobacter sp.]